MSHQDGLGNNGTESTGLTKPDDGDDRMQNESENVAHGQDVIKLNTPQNSERLRNSPTTFTSSATSGTFRPSSNNYCARRSTSPASFVAELCRGLLS
jgi:hypothetical protein